MFSRLREHFGTAGLVVAVVALVAALAGGAIAANGGSGDGKATASAKAKKGPRGPKGPKGDTGPQGPAGPAGAKGDTGAAGANGAAGAGGAKGATGPTGATGPEGPEGEPGEEGLEGPEGSPWTAGGVLPSGKTETGAWSFAVATSGASAYAPISFAIPLAQAIPASNTHIVPKGGPVPAGCTGGTPADPTADPGHLCVYVSDMTAGTITAYMFPAGANQTTFGGASRTGAVVIFLSAAPNTFGHGTFAVTAP